MKRYVSVMLAIVASLLCVHTAGAASVLNTQDVHSALVEFVIDQYAYVYSPSADYDDYSVGSVTSMGTELLCRGEVVGWYMITDGGLTYMSVDKESPVRGTPLQIEYESYHTGIPARKNP